MGRARDGAQRGLAQAQSDLAHARRDVDDGFYDWACFSAQQAAEEALKAVLQRWGATAWGHSVADLLEAVADLRAVPPELRDAGLELDRADIAARYPDAHPSGFPARRYAVAEAERLVGYGEQIVRFGAGLLADAGA